MTMKRSIPWKVWVALPLVVIPVGAALFYGLGGGQPTTTEVTMPTGLNKQLPSSLPPTGNPLDKFSIYQLAAEDSARKAQEKAADPLFSAAPTAEVPATVNGYPSGSASRSAVILSPASMDAQEQKVHEKLALLDQQLKAGVPATPPTDPSTVVLPNQVGHPARVEGTVSAPDPELEQINQVLEKVLDVQHPDRVTQKLQEQSSQQKERVFPVSGHTARPVTDLLYGTPSDTLRRPTMRIRTTEFYEWSLDAPTEVSNTVRAVIHETQAVLPGATIKLRLEQDLFVQGTLIPAGHFVFGHGSLSGDRYTIQIQDIRYQSATYPVHLEAIGMDGMPGIYIQGAIRGEVMKKGAEDGLQSLQLTSLDPSLKAQAAAATVETARNFLSRKMKLTKVTLKAGEPVLLRDNQ